MSKIRIIAIVTILLGLGIGYFLYTTEQSGYTGRFPFRYGLDLDGGTRLVYQADVAQVPSTDVRDAMQTLQQTIERRVNMFGVSEASVTTESGSVLSGSGDDQRLSVELPGVTDVSQAIEMIGQTPLLEFRLENDQTKAELALVGMATSTDEILAGLYNAYEATGLSGGQLKRASVVFGTQLTASPYVLIQFDADGAKLFEKITEANIGKSMAIFLDGTLLSDPVIQTAIYGGEATITGNFTPDEAKQLVQNLNFGALPVPIELIETNTIGPSLGQATLDKGVHALLIAFGIVSLFMISWYRLPGLIATISLAMYVALSLVVFKLIPITLTAPGLAAFILSIGMAVDANVLIFERIHEELRFGKKLREAVEGGFARAWPSIRDGNVTSIISAIILYVMSDAPVVKGFALVFFVGVVVSMITAVVVSRTLLLAVISEKIPVLKTFFGSGMYKNK
jgi:preprotein translocase subunit SecD